MKSKFFGVVVLFLLVLSPLVSFSADSLELNLVYVAKMNDIEKDENGAGGLAELGTLVKTLKNGRHTLYFNGGDFLAPSTMSSFDKGTHMVDILNSVPPDAMAVSKREFSYKEDELVLRIGEAAFPFVSSNIVDPLTGHNLEGVLDYHCFDIGNYKICVYSLIDPDVIESYLPDRIRVVNSFEHAASTADKIRKKEGADLILLMTGYDMPGLDKLLRSGRVDVVMLNSSAEDSYAKTDGRLMIRSGTGKGKAVVADIRISGKGKAMKVTQDAKVVNLADYAPAPEIALKAHYYLSRLSKIMDVEVGKTATMLDTRKEAVRTEENAFANMVSDALRVYYDSDISLVNGGTIRGLKIYPAGSSLTRRDIQGELPFRNNGCVISVSGGQLRQALENGFSKLEDRKGRFPHFSGMKVSYCPQNKAGSRVKSVSVNGQPLDESKMYSLATIDYLLEGGDGYAMFKGAKKIKSKKTNMLLWEIVKWYIEDKKVISPSVEGRLITDCRN
jgi:2',3'-cyclic-nucleotide 2'-phosphodiesterase (5'-nucleotidase family)